MKHFIYGILLSACTALPAQTYDLNSYRFRYEKWQLMGINPSMGGNQSQYTQRQDFLFGLDSLVTRTTEENTHRFNLFLPFFFERYINTERLQHTQVLSFSAGIDKRKAADGSKQFSTEQLLNYRTENRFYKGKQFTELNFSSRNRLYTSKNDYTDPIIIFNRMNVSRTDLNYSLSLGKGRGRMEFVSDAVSAMFLLNDLKAKAGTGAYSNEQLEAVAKGITMIRNRRYMDFRFRVIDQLSMLDSVLKANQVSSSDGIRYFTTMNDNWLYANRFNRVSGQRWSLNLEHDGNRNSSRTKIDFPDSAIQQTLESETVSRSSFNGLSFRYSHSKQLGLFVQRSFEAGLKSGIRFSTNGNEPKYKSDQLLHELYAGFTVLYQPDTRSYLEAGLRGNAFLSSDMNGLRTGNPEGSHYQNMRLNLSPYVQYFRFISQRMFYSVSASFNYNYGKDVSSANNRQDLNNMNESMPFGFGMGLTYLMF